MKIFQPKAIVLEGDKVLLGPLQIDQASGFCEIGADPEIFTYSFQGPFLSVSDTEKWISERIVKTTNGSEVCFAVFDKVSNKLAGSTCFLNIQPAYRSLDIGSTWYGTIFHRTHVNTEAKFLLLQHAFEELGAVRVQFMSDSRNHKSHKAIERLGAMYEGTLRKHKIYRDGYIRDSFVHSIIEDEWPSVKENLQILMRRTYNKNTKKV